MKLTGGFYHPVSPPLGHKYDKFTIQMTIRCMRCGIGAGRKQPTWISGGIREVRLQAPISTRMCDMMSNLSPGVGVLGRVSYSPYSNALECSSMARQTASAQENNSLQENIRVRVRLCKRQTRFVQQERGADRLAGGTLFVASPGLYRYPRALPWDMSAEDLELALEWTMDVGEVTVLYADDGTTRSYQVTFDVRKFIMDGIYMDTRAHS